jgi:hypothetical protein
MIFPNRFTTSHHTSPDKPIRSMIGARSLGMCFFLWSRRICLFSSFSQVGGTKILSAQHTPLHFRPSCFRIDLSQIGPFGVVFQAVSRPFVIVGVMGILNTSFLRLDHGVENDLIAMKPLCILSAALSKKWDVEIGIFDRKMQRITNESWLMYFDSADRLEGILDAKESDDFMDARFEAVASNTVWLYAIEIMGDESQLARFQKCALATDFFEVSEINTARIEHVSSYVKESNLDAPTCWGIIHRWERRKAKCYRPN